MVVSLELRKVGGGGRQRRYIAPTEKEIVGKVGGGRKGEAGRGDLTGCG